MSIVNINSLDIDTRWVVWIAGSLKLSSHPRATVLPLGCTSFNMVRRALLTSHRCFQYGRHLPFEEEHCSCVSVVSGSLEGVVAELSLRRCGHDPIQDVRNKNGFFLIGSLGSPICCASKVCVPLCREWTLQRVRHRLLLFRRQGMILLMQRISGRAFGEGFGHNRFVHVVVLVNEVGIRRLAVFGVDC